MTEILFTCWNRLAYTRASFELLSRNTDWQHVSRLVVYDDGSEDGTLEYIIEAGQKVPVPAFELRRGGWRSLGATMNDFAALTDADQFVKIDNDIAVPPGWLPRLLAVAAANPNVDLVGMEAGWTGAFQGTLRPGKYTLTMAQHIGGVGLMRTQAFSRRRAVPLSLGKNGRAGFTIWQHRHRVPAGWITPDLPVVQFDRIPEEPWQQLSETYVAEGWSRPGGHPPYEPDMRKWWAWIPVGVRQGAERCVS